MSTEKAGGKKYQKQSQPVGTQEVGNRDPEWCACAEVNRCIGLQWTQNSPLKEYGEGWKVGGQLIHQGPYPTFAALHVTIAH